MVVNASKVKVICVGNPSRGDDGVALRVAEHLRDTGPADVEVVTRTGDIMGLVEEWAGVGATVLIDATRSESSPGTITRLDLTEQGVPLGSTTSTHGTGVAELVEMSRVLGRLPGKVVFYGIEVGNVAQGDELCNECAEAAERVAARVVEELRCMSLG